VVELNRRNMLIGAGAFAAASSVSKLITGEAAKAAAPIASSQAPGFYRTKVGDFELTQFSDGARTFPIPDTFVKNVPKQEVLAAAEAAHMPAGKVTVPFNPILINTGSKLVLIDTGFGPGAAAPVGLLASNMAAAGIDPKSIDIVLLSHLHPDHINGIKTADGTLTFPNAEIKAPAADVAFWMSEENAGKAKDDATKNYFANCRKVLGDVMGKITRYDWGKEAAPGITALDTSGHTPGHSSFAVSSGSATMLVQADVTNIPEFFLVHPDWQVMYDYDPEKAAQTRKKFYDMASAEKTLIAGFHFSFPSMGYVEKASSGFRLNPIRWSPVL
jgi:glyoxylase-like metal-dependent hydrolase (beta-lactamase superfamily II)